jgi:hypothetical protein
METPIKALIDGDIIRYEVGFGAETMAKSMGGPDATPSWEMVDAFLEARISEILLSTKATSYQLYVTEGKTFRFALAKSRPYKGQRIEKKPWHFGNLTAHMVNVLGAQAVQQLEADDRLAIDHLTSGGQTVLCSRDKDLRQVPGLFYSWELGHQPAYGPKLIDPLGELILKEGKGKQPPKLTGCGYRFFCAQMIMGDSTDNIPGLPGYGPVAAYELLHDMPTAEQCAVAVQTLYEEEGMGEDYLLEQGRLCWITRRLHPDGSPVLWEKGMTE